MARITQLADIYGRAGCITFHYLKFGRALGIPFTTTNNSFLNVGMSDCPASSQSGTGMNKNSDSRMLRYRTEIQDAGMPMPAALTSMPMPSYGMYRTAYASCMGPIFLNKGAMSMGIFQCIYST
jgi:hypothetical protein